MPTGDDKPDVADPHPLERYLLQTFNINPEQLHRIGMFLLGHVLIDMSLVVLDASFEAKGRGIDRANREALDAVMDRSAQRRFWERHTDAAARGLLTDEDVTVVSKINRARNAFLHYAPQWRLPEYEGSPIIDEHGLRRYLDDVMDYLNRQGPALAPAM